MNEIINAIGMGIPYAPIILALVCVVILYGIVGVSTNYKVIAFLYFVLTAVIGFIFISYIFGVSV